MGFFQRSKDVTIGFAARAAINAKLRGIGEITELKIDTKNKTLWIQLKLIGEQESVEVEIRKYHLRISKSGSAITIEDATSSRQWLTVALRQYVVGQSFPIPPKAEVLLKLLA